MSRPPSQRPRSCHRGCGRRVPAVAAIAWCPGSPVGVGTARIGHGQPDANAGVGRSAVACVAAPGVRGGLAGAGRRGDPVTGSPWLDGTGLVTLPTGPRVRGRRLSDTVSPADFALLLAGGPPPAWRHRYIRWPDFWIPVDRADALDALHEAHRWAHAGERVEVACRGGVGRTGTALAALAILDGLPRHQAIRWIRANYHHRAVETPWQRRWLRAVH
jgi:hypothetical protein